METGEIFEGDPLEVTTKLAEAQVNTKRWGQKGYAEASEWKQKAEAPPPPSKEPTPEEQNNAQTRAWLLDQHAMELGYANAEEYKAELQRIKEASERAINKEVAADFLAQCPDFPNTQESVDAVAMKIQQNNWKFSPESMIAAHTVCLREGKYKALDEQEQRHALGDQAAIAQQRGTPPPMIRSGAPDNNNRGQENPYAMKLEDLRAMAIKQQLEGR